MLYQLSYPRLEPILAAQDRGRRGVSISTHTDGRRLERAVGDSSEEDERWRRFRPEVRGFRPTEGRGAIRRPSPVGDVYYADAGAGAPS